MEYKIEFKAYKLIFIRRNYP